jgi:hypothetical protein
MNRILKKKIIIWHPNAKPDKVLWYEGFGYIGLKLVSMMESILVLKTRLIVFLFSFLCFGGRGAIVGLIEALAPIKILEEPERERDPFQSGISF